MLSQGHEPDGGGAGEREREKKPSIGGLDGPRQTMGDIQQTQQSGVGQNVCKVLKNGKGGVANRG
jgi:hypothetical protein